MLEGGVVGTVDGGIDGTINGVDVDTVEG